MILTEYSVSYQFCKYNNDKHQNSWKITCGVNVSTVTQPPSLLIRIFCIWVTETKYSYRKVCIL